MLGIGYGDDVEQAWRFASAALAQCRSVLAEPKPDVLLTQLASSRVNLRIRRWIDSPAVAPNN